MKNKIRRLFTLCMILLLLPCGSTADEKKLSIVTTSFPCFDFTRAVAGNLADIKMLLPPGGEAHSFEPTPQDIIAAQTADLFVYVGGESDVWVETLLTSMGDHAPTIFRLTDHVTLLSEELSASMQPVDEKEYHGESEMHEHDGEEEEVELDEHVWTSPKRAIVLTEALCETLCELSPDDADTLRDNLQTERTALQDLDHTFEEIISNSKHDIIVFGDRFPFRYFAADYHLRYDAAFPGCSEDSEPSVRTVISLIDLIREEKLPVVFYMEFSSRRTADIVAEETGAVPLLFHSCHNVSQAELDSGATYLSLMKSNAENLRRALESSAE